MQAWGPQLSPGSGAGCGPHQPPPPMLMSFRSMQMPKVGLSSFWSLALGRAGVCVCGGGSELGSCCHLCPLFAKRMGRKTI